MTSNRQIAANRCNACRSTGPRSTAGRKRSSRNSLRHGLVAVGIPSAERIAHVERLAREIAGASTDIVILECARTIAQAEFELAQIRRVKVGLVSRVMAFGEIKRPPSVQLIAEAKRFFRALDRGELIPFEGLRPPAMPTTEPECTAEAIRRALPELIKVERYERRAAGRRARAMRVFLERKKIELRPIVQEARKCKTDPIFS
jgi:hypothetical protein